MATASPTQMKMAVRQIARARNGGLSRTNSRLCYALLMLIALSPLPLASARPFFWAISGLVVGLIGVIYGFSLWHSRQDFRLPVTRLLWLGFPYLGLVLFMVAQALPLGDLTGPFSFSGRATSIEGGYLSLTPGLTWLTLLQTASYGLFFFLVAQTTVNKNRARFFLTAVFAILTAYALYGLLLLTQFGDTILFMEKWAYQGSATGPFVNRNSYATFLAFGLVIGLALILTPTSSGRYQHTPTPAEFLSIRTVALLIALVLVLAALLASQSRMGLFAGMAGALVVLVASALKLRLQLWGWLAMMGAALAAGGGLLGLYGTGVLERVGSLESSADVRGALYLQVWEMIAARPLLGYGAGSFEYVYPLWHTWPVSPDYVWNRAHSTYLTLWSELGVLAGSLPLVIISLIFVTAIWQLIRRRSYLPFLVCVGVTIVAAIHSLVDFSLEMQPNIYLFFAVLAVSVASSYQPESKDKI